MPVDADSIVPDENTDGETDVKASRLVSQASASVGLARTRWTQPPQVARIGLGPRDTGVLAGIGLDKGNGPRPRVVVISTGSDPSSQASRSAMSSRS